MTIGTSVDAAAGHRGQDERRMHSTAQAEIEGRVGGRRSHRAVAVELGIEFEPRRHWTAYDEAENPFLWPIAGEEVPGFEADVERSDAP
ncbi:MAG TPA: hypothetical protein VH109_10005 [Steroidobacteraceae bacterium]|nr:hypothetical protein [Steroidobacteraceae bacterium]